MYFWSEVEAFALVFYRPREKQTAVDHAKMQACLQPAVDRFKSLEDEERRGEFREKLKGYVSIYAFLSQVMPYGDPALEMLYSYARLLLPHLPLDRDTEAVKLGDEVSLEYYRLQRIFSGEIPLGQGEADGVKSPTNVGTGKTKDEKAPLSEIVESLNERFGTNFAEEDRLFFEQIREKASRNPRVIETALANPLDKFQLGIRKFIEEFMVQRMDENDKIVTRYMDDMEFQNAAYPILVKAIFETVRERAAVQPGIQ